MATDLYHRMLAYDYGDQASPLHGRPGRWYRGGATIHGWTWMGFSTEAEMNQFVERWPSPEPGYSNVPA